MSNESNQKYLSEFVLIMSFKQDPQFQLISEQLNNASKMMEFQRNDYILLIKRQKQRNYLTLYLSDCGQRYWVQKITTNYCQKLKEQLQVKSTLQSFLKMLAVGLKKTAKIVSMDQNPILQIAIQISQGLNMKCKLELQIQISKKQNELQFTKLNKNFFKQLYESKQQQVVRQKNILIEFQESLKTKKNAQKEVNDPGYISSVLNGQRNHTNHKTASSRATKNRDLVNPNKKKRRNCTIKYQDAQ